MDQCSILYIRERDTDEPRTCALRSLGFRVDESPDLPANDAFAEYHAVIVHPSATCHLPMLAARLRAKPRFGRRVLLALVPETMKPRDRGDAVLSGFDATMPETCGARDLAATVLRLLRPYPEYRCLLRSPGGRRKAA